jgi:hypothetical protein
LARYVLSVMADGHTVADETLRAGGNDQARAQMQLRFAQCRPGESLRLTLDGVEIHRLGPRRAT